MIAEADGEVVAAAVVQPDAQLVLRRRVQRRRRGQLQLDLLARVLDDLVLADALDPGMEDVAEQRPAAAAVRLPDPRPAIPEPNGAESYFLF
jgi:hypothetical protein